MMTDHIIMIGQMIDNIYKQGGLMAFRRRRRRRGRRFRGYRVSRGGIRF